MSKIFHKKQYYKIIYKPKFEIKVEKKNKNETYIWACDFKENSGEGKLARLFIDFYIRKKLDTKITIDTPIAKYIFNKKLLKLKKK